MSFTVETDTQIPMRDGVHLATDIWRPEGSAPVPTLLMRLPYGKDAITIILGGNGFPAILSLIQDGYAIAIQDCRGTYRSEGTFIPHIDDAADGADTVGWLASQPWCDGNIGMYGGSYLGFVQWQAAATGVSELKAIAPRVSSADLYRAPWYSAGGALSLDCILIWANIMSLQETRAGSVEHRGDIADLPALAGMGINPGPTFEQTPVASHPLLDKHAPWLRDLLTTPLRSEFWDARISLDHHEQITTPALSIGGWYDLFFAETLRAYTTMRSSGGSQDAREGQRLIMGPWSHTNSTGMFPDRLFGLMGSSDSADLTTVHIAFFDRWLKGKTDALDGLAPVRIFVMGINEWRDEQEWPLPDTNYVRYYLDGTNANSDRGAGTLVPDKPTSESTETYIYDPRRPVPSVGGVSMLLAEFNGPLDQREIESRDDVLCFTTPALSAPVEVTGPVTLTLHVSSSCVDTDFTGKLVDVHPDGRAIILCEGIQRMRYRDTLAEEHFITPGGVYEITIDMAATSNVFLPGHQIRLEVSSSNFPRYDRNSNTGGTIAEEHLEEMTVAVNNIHHGPDHLSHLTLPFVHR